VQRRRERGTHFMNLFMMYEEANESAPAGAKLGQDLQPVFSVVSLCGGAETAPIP